MKIHLQQPAQLHLMLQLLLRLLQLGAQLLEFLGFSEPPSDALDQMVLSGAAVWATKPEARAACSVAMASDFEMRLQSEAMQPHYIAIESRLPRPVTCIILPERDSRSPGPEHSGPEKFRAIPGQAFKTLHWPGCATLSSSEALHENCSQD